MGPKESAPKPPSNRDNENNNNNNNNNEEKQENKEERDDPQNLKLSLFDSYNQSKIYNEIRKRRREKKLNNKKDDEQISKKETKIAKKVTISDLKSHRILYEMNNYQYKWFW